MKDEGKNDDKNMVACSRYQSFKDSGADSSGINTCSSHNYPGRLESGSWISNTGRISKHTDIHCMVACCRPDFLVDAGG